MLCCISINSNVSSKNGAIAANIAVVVAAADAAVAAAATVVVAAATAAAAAFTVSCAVRVVLQLVQSKPHYYCQHCCHEGKV